jgi:hypothetical protein
LWHLWLLLYDIIVGFIVWLWMISIHYDLWAYHSNAIHVRDEKPGWKIYQTSLHHRYFAVKYYHVVFLIQVGWDNFMVNGDLPHLIMGHHFRSQRGTTVGHIARIKSTICCWTQKWCLIMVIFPHVWLIELLRTFNFYRGILILQQCSMKTFGQVRQLPGRHRGVSSTPSSTWHRCFKERLCVIIFQ